MALTANRELNRYVDQELRSFPVAAGAHIYKGVFVGVDRTTGFARNLVAGDVFAGIAYEEMDNTGGLDGAMSVRLYTQGDFILTVNGATQSWVGAPVYATANDVTSVAPPAGASYVGMLMNMTGANQGVVRIMPLANPQIERSTQTPLTSLTTGATSNPVLITQRAIKVISVQVSFNTIPNQGALDVGTDNADPDEIIDAFNLATLTAHTPAVLTIVGTDFAKNLRIWAKVGQASTTVGVGGLLSMRYFELP
jgi:hypothetical protein